MILFSSTFTAKYYVRFLCNTHLHNICISFELKKKKKRHTKTTGNRSHRTILHNVYVKKTL